MMNRSVVAASIVATLAAATAACGNASSSGTPIAQKPANAQSHLASRPSSPAPVRTTRRGLTRSASVARPPSPIANASPAIAAKYRAFAAAFDLDARVAGTPGAAVALIEHGRVSFTHAYGTTGLKSTAPVDADTIFRVGTMTQPLTAAAELALIDEGKGTLGESVSTLVPNVALTGADAASLTARQLLSNQSGLYDFTAWSYDPTLATLSCATDPGSLNAFVTGATFGQNELFVTPPGALYTASNPNFILTGAAIEQQTGAFFADAMKSVLFAPLGMTRTFFVPSDVTSAGNYANGAIYAPDGTLADVAPDAYDCAAYRPYGYASSSVTDYAKFVQLLLEGNPKVLSNASRVAMESVQVETRDLGHLSAQGFGLTVNRGYVTQSNVFYPTKTVSSVGQIQGYSSLFYAFPETGFGVVVLSNFGGSQFVHALDIAVRSFAGLPAPEPLPPSTFAVPGRFARYAGTYLDPTGTVGRVVVSDAGGALTVDFPDAADLGLAFWPQLTPVLDDSFLVTFFGYPNTLQFVPDGRGRYGYLLIDDGIPATRVAPDAGP